MIVNLKGREIKGKMSKAEKCAYAKGMKEKETRIVMNNPTVVSRDSQLFRETVKRQLALIGVK